jgi:cytochrome P450
LQRDFSLLGHQLVAGQAVNACVVLAHRRQEAFPQPDRFRPERFLERSFSPFEFLPFGGGVRRCPGASLALLELKVVLAALLSRYRFRLAPDRSEPLTRQHTVMGPRGGVRMAVVETLRGRRGDHRD